MAAPVVTVEPVEATTQLRRFRDVPFLLHRHDDRWRPGVRAYEQWRLDSRRHPYFDRGDAAYLLARRGGHPVGRIAAHVPTRDATAGHFGFFDAPDDDEVVTALLDAARTWLTDEGATSMTGPVSWTPDEEFGVMVRGHAERTRTGRAWQPPWYAERLHAAGLEPGPVRDSYALATEPAETAPPPAGEEAPPHAGGFADDALVLEGIAAVPDVTATLSGASLRSAWRVARRARTEGFDTAVCVRWDDDGDLPVLVARLQRAAGAAGYRTLLAPWAPPGHEPETTHQVFTLSW